MQLSGVGGYTFVTCLLLSAPVAAQDVVLHATDVSVIKGHWTRVTDASAASQKKMTSANSGWSSPDAPVTSPTHYFEASFTAQAWKPYRLWLRVRAASNSKWNDAVWVQFTNSVGAGGGAQYRIGSTSAVLVNRESCQDCGMSAWGWTNDAWWKAQDTLIEFSTAGTQTIRVQTREDGVEIDQIVLSPQTYLSAPPGSVNNDSRILARQGGVAAPATGPYGGTPRAIPGTIQAEDFDNGSNGVAYRDESAGNNGGQYRSTDVDIERTSDSAGGVYNLAWIGSGEWLTYTVNVATAGTYTLTARVANTAAGGRLHVEFNGVNKTGAMAVPNSGGWQSYRDVTATVTLSAGQQTMRVSFDTEASNGAVGNINYIRLASGSAAPPPPPPTGTKLKVMTWNVHFGKNTSNVLNLDAQANIMANSGAHVILLQEASTWDGDQPNRFPELLRARTGHTWYKVWAPHVGTSGEGTLILTRLPIVASSTANFYDRGFGRVVVSVNGVNVTLFNVHLTYDPSSRRTLQLNSWMPWSTGFSGPAIAGGDFNAWWGQSWIYTVETKYTDTWQDVTGSDQNGYTHNNIRFDYLFRALHNNWRLTPTSCVVIQTSTSDHRPLVAEYTVR
jgi:endonuclease/exonuclease/phosphatase family metal-dependent hydrolase